MDVLQLAERLIAFNTSTRQGLNDAAGFIESRLEANGLEVRRLEIDGLPILVSSVGSGDITVVFHGHIDVVPGRTELFVPQRRGDRLYGRGAYDMKGAVAAMMSAFTRLRDEERVKILLEIVPDEESEDIAARASDHLVRQGYGGDFAITGEPTDFRIGVQAKGVLALGIEVSGTAAHGSRPWLGENAILGAVELFRTVESMPFLREVSPVLGSPSVNLGRISGGEAINMVPESCAIDLDIRFLPGQDPTEIAEKIGATPGVRINSLFVRKPIAVDPKNPFVEALRQAAQPYVDGDVVSVGRDGSSDAVSFIEAGIPAVEFGPIGAGHHGPKEWVSADSLVRYGNALVDFVTQLPDRLEGLDRSR